MSASLCIFSASPLCHLLGGNGAAKVHVRRVSLCRLLAAPPDTNATDSAVPTVSLLPLATLQLNQHFHVWRVR